MTAKPTFNSLLVHLLVGCLACQAPPAPAPRDLDRGARVIQEMTRHRKLEGAGFFSEFPEPKPSDFISFIHSDLGVALWPPREGSPFIDQLELEQSRAIGETLIPEGVAFKRNRPDPEGGRQIVYRADDDRGELVVEAYLDPSSEPVFVQRWKFPR
jgi:hypothetical protein